MISSLEWTSTVLFRPFRLKKWLILGFVAFMAGYLGGGGNFRLPNLPMGEHRKADAAPSIYTVVRSPALQHSPEDSSVSESEMLAEFFKKLPVWVFVVSGALLLAFIVLFNWLGARFSFIFIDNVVASRACVRKPFKEYRAIGNSLFLFNMAYTLIFLSLLAIIISLGLLHLRGLGVFTQPENVGIKKIILSLLPYGFGLLVFFILAGLLGLFLREFVLLIMFKEKIRVLAAWAKAWNICRVHRGTFAKFILLDIGLNICAGICYGLISFALVLGLILPGALLAGIIYLIYQILPASLHAFYFAFLAVLAVLVFIILWYLFVCLYLPFAVFLRTLSIKFLARLRPEYNLFNSVVTV